MRFYKYKWGIFHIKDNYTHLYKSLSYWCVFNKLICNNILYEEIRSYFYLWNFMLLISSHVYYIYDILHEDGHVGRDIS